MDPRTAFTLAVRSLDGETVFPKEAGEAAAIFRRFLAYMDTKDTEKKGTEQLFVKGLADAIGIDPAQIKIIGSMTGSLPPEMARHVVKAINARLQEAGIEPDALQAEMMAAMEHGDQDKVTELMKRMTGALKPNLVPKE